MVGRRKTLEEFITDMEELYPDEYNYHLVEYINNKIPVKIECKKHGAFEKRSDSLLRGIGCNECSLEFGKNQNFKDTVDRFIEKSIKVHGEKYDYSKVSYVNRNIKVILVCKLHGEFLMKPGQHINNKSGCKKCSIISNADRCRNDTNELVTKFNRIHKDKYTYNNVTYKNIDSKISITCKEHGEFLQTPRVHMNYHGCPKCRRNMSLGEIKIKEYLEEMNIEFEMEKKFEGCRGINLLRFDFYLPKYNTCLEFDGVQHTDKSHFFNQNINYSQKHDNIKNKFCLDNDIKLIRINDIKSIDNLIFF